MKTRQIFRFTNLMVFVVIFFVTAFLILASQMNHNLDKGMDRYMNETLKQGLTVVQGQIDNRYSFLESVAVCLGNRDSFQMQKTRQLLDKQTKLQSCKSFFVITKDGKAHLDNGQVKDVHDNICFQMALKGKRAASEWQPSLVDGEVCMWFAVPIESQNGIVGVLCGEYTKQQMNQLLTTPIFEGKDMIQIMNCRGMVIANQGSPYQFSSYYNFLSQTRLKSGMTIDRFKQEIKEGNNGVLSFEYKRQVSYVGYASIGINDWYLLVSAPASGAHPQSPHIGAWWTMWIAGITLTCIILIIKKQRKNRKVLEQEKQELKILAGCIPGGIFRYTLKENAKINYISEGLLELFGCSEREFFEWSDPRLTNVVYKPDQEKVKEFVKNLGDGEYGDQIEYRIIDRSGRVTWVYDSRKGVSDKGQKDGFYALIMDITPQKRAKEEVEISEERFRLIIEKTDNIVYEWDIKKDSVVFSSPWKRKLGHPLIEEHFLEDMGSRNIVHKDDVEKQTSLFNQIKIGEISYGEAIIRLYNKLTKEFVWMKTCSMSIRDSQGIPIQVVGIAIDIDEQIIETLELKKQAEHDSLTGLYNRGTVETLIANAIAKGGSKKFHAFILIDIDDFKEINDSMGHMVGDQVLKEVSKKIKYAFRSDDIMGRLGGDEFVLFIKNIPSKEFLSKKMERICKEVESPLFIVGKNMRVTFSMGIALYNQDGDTYNELYRKADCALYSVKRNSKNNFNYYSSEMDEQGFLLD